MRTFEKLLKQSTESSKFYRLAERGGVWDLLNEEFAECMPELTDEETDEYFDKLIIKLQEDALGLTRAWNRVRQAEDVIEALDVAYSDASGGRYFEAVENYWKENK